MYKYHWHKHFKIQIIFPPSLLHFQHTFSACAWNYVCRSRKNLWWSVSVHPSGGGGNRMDVEWCWIKIIGRMRTSLIFLFDRILRIRRFNSFNVCSYRTMPIVTPLFRHVRPRSTAQRNWRLNFSDFEPVTFLSFLHKYKGITFYRIFSNICLFLSPVIYSYFLPIPAQYYSS